MAEHVYIRGAYESDFDRDVEIRDIKDEATSNKIQHLYSSFSETKCSFPTSLTRISLQTTSAVDFHKGRTERSRANSSWL